MQDARRTRFFQDLSLQAQDNGQFRECSWGFKATIHPDVYKANAEDCPKVNGQSATRVQGSLAYDCPPLVDSQGNPTDFSKRSRFYPDTEIEYTFQVDGHPVLAVGDDAEF